MQTSVKSFQLMFLILSRSWQISKEKWLDRPVGQVIASTYLRNMVLFKKSKQEMLQLVNVNNFLLGVVEAYKTWNGSLSWLVGLLSFSSCCDLLGPYCRKTWYDNQHCTIHDMPLITYNTNYYARLRKTFVTLFFNLAPEILGLIRCFYLWNLAKVSQKNAWSTS